MAGKDSELDPAGPLTGAEIVGIVQAGVSVQTTLADIAALATGSGGAAIGVQMAAELANTTDSAPGAGLLKWNHATQGSATFLYLDDVTADGVSLATVWANLDAGGFAYLQHATNQDIWQIWEITAVTDASGYVKLAAGLLANGGSFADGDPMLVTLEQGATGGAFTGGSLSSALNEAKGTDIASAGTTNIGAASGNLVHITGTTTITAFDTVQAGSDRMLVFDGALTLTHNATSLILPTGANIATAAGDTAWMRSEGSGNWRCVMFMRKSGAALAGGGSLANFTEGVNTSAPNATIPVVSFAVTNAAGHADVAILPKGSGAILAHVPNNAAAGGNKRGNGAVDLQRMRASADQVASGNNSVISGGANNKSSGAASGVGYGSDNIADADYSTAGGYNSSARGRLGYEAHASGTFAGGLGNEAQQGRIVLRAATSNATQTALTSDGGAGSATNQVSMTLRSRNCVVKGTIQAHEKTTDDCSAWEFTAFITRPFTGSVAMVVACTPALIGQKAGASAWAVAVDADTTNNALRVRCTGEAAKNIRWVCSVFDVNELGFF